MKSVLEAVNNIKALIEHNENEEVIALFDLGRHVVLQGYKNWYAVIWNSWSRKEGATQAGFSGCGSTISRTNDCNTCECWREAWSSIEDITAKQTKCCF